MTAGRDLIPVVDDLAAFDDESRENIRAIVAQGGAANTRRAYESDLRYVDAWLKAIGEDGLSYPLPAAYVIRFIADHQQGLAAAVDEALVLAKFKKPGNHKISTIKRRVSALSTAHSMRDVVNPCADRKVLSFLDLARAAAVKAGYRPNKKRGLKKADMEKVLATRSENYLIDIRDRALLLFGFATGGRRRSEISAALITDLREVDDGYIYKLPYSKTDQAGRGSMKPLRGKAAAAVRHWLQELEQRGIRNGRLFRSINRFGDVGEKLSTNSVAEIIRGRAADAGLDPTQFGGHSLRRGFMTEARRQGILVEEAMAMASMRSISTAQEYFEAESVLINQSGQLLDDKP